jgi:hypothetical protein
MVMVGWGGSLSLFSLSLSSLSLSLFSLSLSLAKIKCSERSRKMTLFDVGEREMTVLHT